jgi:CheY-like chemotaxis protein
VVVAVSAPAPVVLCVDDDPEIVASVARFLRLDGYEVVTCTSPVAALNVLGARAVAVLVSDYEMPEMTGVELAVKARRLQPETVRMLLTGRGTLDTAVEGINVGEVFRFLSKPFDPAALGRRAGADHGRAPAEAGQRPRGRLPRHHRGAARRRRFVPARRRGPPQGRAAAVGDDGADPALTRCGLGPRASGLPGGGADGGFDGVRSGRSGRSRVPAGLGAARELLNRSAR